MNYYNIKFKNKKKKKKKKPASEAQVNRRRSWSFLSQNLKINY